MRTYKLFDCRPHVTDKTSRAMILPKHRWHVLCDQIATCNPDLTLLLCRTEDPMGEMKAPRTCRVLALGEDGEPMSRGYICHHADVGAQPLELPGEIELTYLIEQGEAKATRIMLEQASMIEQVQRTVNAMKQHLNPPDEAQQGLDV